RIRRQGRRGRQGKDRGCSEGCRGAVEESAGRQGCAGSEKRGVDESVAEARRGDVRAIAGGSAGGRRRRRSGRRRVRREADGGREGRRRGIYGSQRQEVILRHAGLTSTPR